MKADANLTELVLAVLIQRNGGSVEISVEEAATLPVGWTSRTLNVEQHGEVFQFSYSEV